MSCPYGSFLMPGSKVALLHKFVDVAPSSGWTSGMMEDEEKEECVIVGVEDPEATVDSLWSHIGNNDVSEAWSDESCR